MNGTPLARRAAPLLASAILFAGACTPGRRSPPREQREHSPPEATESSPDVARLGELEARWMGGTDGRGGGDGPVIVLLHGYGAEADDLAGVAQHLPVPPSFRFVLLGAPLTLPQGGRAWFAIDREKRRRAVAEGKLRELARDVPDGLEGAHDQLLTALAALRKRDDVDPHLLGIVGFSQGAMMATDLALFAEPRVQALGILAGTMLAEDVWRDRALRNPGLPTFLAHGRADPILPFEMAKMLREVLDDGRLDVRFHPHDGGHEIPDETLRALGAFLTEVFGTIAGE